MQVCSLLLCNSTPFTNVGVSIRDSERKTLLHLACDCPREEDTKDMVAMLLQR